MNETIKEITTPRGAAVGAGGAGGMTPAKPAKRPAKPRKPDPYGRPRWKAELAQAKRKAVARLPVRKGPTA